MSRVIFPASWTDPESPGYGTYPGPYAYRDLKRYAQAVAQALALGYRHIDTAQAYANEKFVGAAIRAGGVPRDDIFLTSKLDPGANSRRGALKAIAASSRALGTIPDMYLIHYPGQGSAIEAWKGLVEARDQGLCRRIGVSNFVEHHLAALIERTGETPAVNQIEFHPHLWSESLSNLVEFCRRQGVLVEGYSPFAEGKTGLLKEPVVLNIAAAHDSTPARVILKWSMRHRVRPIAGSLSEPHMADNFGPCDLTLTQQDMNALDALGALQARISLSWGWDPVNARLE